MPEKPCKNRYFKGIMNIQQGIITLSIVFELVRIIMQKNISCVFFCQSSNIRTISNMIKNKISHSLNCYYCFRTCQIPFLLITLLIKSCIFMNISEQYVILSLGVSTQKNMCRIIISWHIIIASTIFGLKVNFHIRP